MPVNLQVDNNLGSTGQYIKDANGNSSPLSLTDLATGNVGIGTATPGSYKLNVNGNSFFNGNIEIRDNAYIQLGINDGSGSYLAFRRWNTQTNPTPPTNGAAIYYNSAADGTNEKLGFNLAGTECLTIKTNGNVGIGTASPTEKLHVNGDIRIDGTTYASAGNPASYLKITVNGTTYKIALLAMS